jgi:tubulin-specific chaperone A
VSWLKFVQYPAKNANTTSPAPCLCCCRLQKEVVSYEKEATENEAKVQKMRDEGKDAHDVRKQEEVLAESCMMIPDSKNRLKSALEELAAFVEASEDEEGFKEASDLKEVRELLQANEL